MEIAQTAIVTGGAQGIGLAISHRLSRSGYHVQIWDREAVAAESAAAALTSAGGSAVALGIDVTNFDEVAAAVGAIETIDLLVNNAGIFYTRPLLELQPDDYRATMEVNVVALATVSQAAVGRMHPGGRIVHISSRSYLGGKNYAHYAASKAAVVGLTRSMAIELAGNGIRVNAVAPGAIDTAMFRSLDPAAQQAMIDAQPLAEVGQPDDIAAAVDFLGSTDARFITGQVLLVDGGRSL